MFQRYQDEVSRQFFETSQNVTKCTGLNSTMLFSLTSDFKWVDHTFWRMLLTAKGHDDTLFND
jgi:hypothetical protein